MTEEETAAELSRQEGVPVSILDVRRLEAQGLRKLRKLLGERGMHLGDMLPDG